MIVVVGGLPDRVMYLDVDTRLLSQAFYTFGVSMIALIVTQEFYRRFLDVAWGSAE